MTMNINRAQLLGVCVRAAEARNLPSGVTVANFSLMLTESFTDRSGQPKTRTSYVKVNCWQELAEKAATIATKGATIYAEGRLQSSSWTDRQTGEKKYSLEVTAFSISDHAPQQEEKREKHATSRASGTAAAEAILSRAEQ